MINYPYPSLAKFTAFVQLKDFRGPTKKEYVRYIRRLGDHYQCDLAILTEELLTAGKLRPLGRPNTNAVKFFSAGELMNLLGRSRVAR
jgi:hypothetical protein